ncbi:hypothetical protein [Halococcus sp. IIIV-5B]|uniref:hypothetical protein n=1 Tax=Halococcus sp. IIIV-5B TaxID=2321230 RepID=UPI0013144614|nr:hypothetical protein [Halococcus sp. IIIV-5B]
MSNRSHDPTAYQCFRNEEIEELHEVRNGDELREALADDLGGKPENSQMDYPRAERLDE